MTMTYKASGVDIAAGQALVERITPFAKKTHRPGVMGHLGGFGGLFDLSACAYTHPILVSATDGVGTKLKLALQAKSYLSIGIDVVAMCVNDVITCGAAPLFFLDYYATRQLDVDIAATVIEGIAQGCQQAGAALLGGETAEMPGVYHGQDIDVAGFCVGVVEKAKRLSVENVCVGDILIGLPSSGPHANGFSLIRHILTAQNIDVSHNLSGKPLIDHLTTPTSIYVNSAHALCQDNLVNGMAHITGGGLIENVPRMLPQGTCARIDTQSWQQPPLFAWLQKQGHISDTEMRRTFNCGVGMVLCVPAAKVTQALSVLAQQGQTAAWRMGRVDNQPHPNAPSVLFE